MRFKGGKSAIFLLIFLIFTFFVSVFMLLAIFFYNQMGTTDYRTLCSQQYERKLQYFIFRFFFSLAIKIPKIPLLTSS